MERLFINMLLVGAGGCVGSVARYLLALGSQGLSMTLPFGTFFANTLGCFVIGFVSQLSVNTGLVRPHTRLLLTTGFCGGFTTMSSFVYEASHMIETGEYLRATTYLGATLAGSFIAFFAGIVLARVVLKTMGGLWN
jgi:CrcB protein